MVGKGFHSHLNQPQCLPWKKETEVLTGVTRLDRSDLLPISRHIRLMAFCATEKSFHHYILEVCVALDTINICYLYVYINRLILVSAAQDIFVVVLDDSVG